MSQNHKDTRRGLTPREALRLFNQMTGRKVPLDSTPADLRRLADLLDPPPAAAARLPRAA